VAVDAPDEMDIMRALAIEERRVHGRDVTLTIGDRGMAVLTARPGSVAVVLMACQAADPLVHAARRSIVACPRLMKGVGRVTLNANPLPEIVGDLHLAVSLMKLDRRKICCFYISLIIAVIPQRRSERVLAGVKDVMRVVIVRGNGRGPVTMDLVAGETWDCGSR